MNDAVELLPVPSVRRESIAEQDSKRFPSRVQRRPPEAEKRDVNGVNDDAKSFLIHTYDYYDDYAIYRCRCAILSDARRRHLTAAAAAVFFFSSSPSRYAAADAANDPAITSAIPNPSVHPIVSPKMKYPAPAAYTADV